jgi:hypothetical protein
LLDLALFVALVKWLSTDRAKDQNQTDRLFHRLTKEDSSTFNYDNDWIHNPIYSAYIGNVFHIADPWDDPAHGHLHDDYCQHDHWH